MPLLLAPEFWGPALPWDMLATASPCLFPPRWVSLLLKCMLIPHGLQWNCSTLY